MKTPLQPQLTHSSTQHTFTKACSARLGTMGRTREASSLNFPLPRSGGKAGAGQGTEDEAQICVLPSEGTSTGPRAGLGQAQCNSSCTPPLPEVPEALGSFPNEAPGRTLPN